MTARPLDVDESAADGVADAPVDDRPAASVTVYPDGPLIVRGDFVLRELDGAPLAGGHTIALCRCGRSARKPFCDGSHKRRRAVHPAD